MIIVAFTLSQHMWGSSSGLRGIPKALPAIPEVLSGLKLRLTNALAGGATVGLVVSDALLGACNGEAVGIVGISGRQCFHGGKELYGNPNSIIQITKSAATDQLCSSKLSEKPWRNRVEPRGRGKIPGRHLCRRDRCAACNDRECSNCSNPHLSSPSVGSHPDGEGGGRGCHAPLACSALSFPMIKAAA